MIEIVILVVVLLSLFLMVFLRKRDTPEKLENPSNPYEAHALDECDFSCSEAFKLSGKVFLKQQTPELPLSACDKKPSCRCRFIPCADRRQNEVNRRSGSRVLQDTFVGHDNRKASKRGRRWDD